MLGCNEDRTACTSATRNTHNTTESAGVPSYMNLMHILIVCGMTYNNYSCPKKHLIFKCCCRTVPNSHAKCTERLCIKTWETSRLMPILFRCIGSILVEHMLGLLCLPISPSVCMHKISWEWLNGFSWNLVWTLCHWRLPQTRPY